MTLYCNGIKVCPTITINGGGDIDHGGAYLIKVIDYDGTVLKQDHLNTGDTFELPEPPTNHERLTFQTWSSPLQIANNTITVGKSDVTIGAVYTTKSGLNEYVVELNQQTGLTISVRNSSDNEISWGDGTSDTGGFFVQHTYNDYGTYVITSAKPYGTPNKGVVEVNLSSASYVNPILNGYYKGITIPNTLAQSNNGLFQLGLYTLKSLIFPPVLTSIASNASGLRLIEYFNIQDVVIPYGVTNFTVGSFTASYLLGDHCYAIEKITFPSTITEVPDLFKRDSNGYQPQYSIKELNFTEHASVPTLGNKGQTISGDLVRNPYFKIRVPKSLESAWKSATNWSAYADYIIGVE